MKKYVLFLLIFFLISATTGCETVSRKLATPTQPVISQPLFTHWEMVGNPQVTQDGVTCVINGFYFSSRRILILYTLSGSSSDKLAADLTFQIVDDSGSISQLVEIIPIRNIDQLEYGIMVFEPRRIGVRDIYLATTAKSDPKINQKIELAHLTGSVFEDHIDRTFYGATLKNSELGGFQISILWSAPPVNQTGGAVTNSLPESTPVSGNPATPTVAVRPPVVSLPPGVFIQGEFSFKVQNIAKQQAQYLGAQLYSDGSVALISDGMTIPVAPIVLITPTPINMTYPPPSSSTPVPTATPKPSPYP